MSIRCLCLGRLSNGPGGAHTRRTLWSTRLRRWRFLDVALMKRQWQQHFFTTLSSKMLLLLMILMTRIGTTMIGMTTRASITTTVVLCNIEVRCSFELLVVAFCFLGFLLVVAAANLVLRKPGSAPICRSQHYASRLNRRSCWSRTRCCRTSCCCSCDASWCAFERPAGIQTGRRSATERARHGAVREQNQPGHA